MKNPSWYEDPPEDEPEEMGEEWDTPEQYPYQDRDCDYWNKTT